MPKVKKIKLPNGDELSLGNEGTSLPLFSPVLQDHILSFEESKGYALQGTWVYKESAPERYGYPDFYNKCVEEYNNSQEVEQYFKSNITPFGSLIDSQGVLSSFSDANYGALPNAFPTNMNSFECIFKVDVGTVNTSTNTNAIVGCVVNYTGFIIGINSSKFNLYLTSNGTSWDMANNKVGSYTVLANTTYYLKLEFTGTNYILSYSLDGENYIEDNNVANTKALYPSTLLLGKTKASGQSFTDGSIDLNESYININGERWWNGIQKLKIYQNSNGHQFYNLTEKSKIDELYQEQGTAWYYGIDEVNERIFLPRTTFFKENKILPVRGNGLALGLTNGTSNCGLAQYSAGSANATATYSGSYGVTLPASLSGSHVKDVLGITTDAEKSGIVAINEREKDTNKWMYIIVGNTEQESAITDVTEVTTSENDTIPLFTGMYFDFKPNNVSWLKAGTQQNSGSIYTSAYNELVNELTNPKYGLNVVEESEMISGVDYSEYWKVNQDEMYFVTPTKLSYSMLNDNIIPVVGNGMTLGISDGTNTYGLNQHAGGNYHYLQSYSNYAGLPLGSSGSGTTSSIAMDVALGVTTDSTKSGIVVDLSNAKSDTAQLYFKVANAVQNLELLDAGEVLESLSDKIGRQECVSYVTDTYSNGSSWYRIWSPDHTGRRWCEQGSIVTYAATYNWTKKVKFLKEFADLEYQVRTIAYASSTSPNATGITINVLNKETDAVTLINWGYASAHANIGFEWNACGYLKDDEDSINEL